MTMIDALAEALHRDPVFGDGPNCQEGKAGEIYRRGAIRILAALAESESDFGGPVPAGNPNAVLPPADPSLMGTEYQPLGGPSIVDRLRRRLGL